MISFIKRNFKIGDTINIPCAEGNVISGSLLEINDEDIKITENNGETRVMKCNISTPISFITESIQNDLPKTTEHLSPENVIKDISTPLVVNESKHISPPKQYSHLQNYIRFKAGKLPPDGRIISKREPFMVENLSDNKKYPFSIGNVIDEDIKNSLRKKYYNGDCVNYYLDSHKKVSLLHNMKVENLLTCDLEDNIKQQLENYIRHKLEQMMPGGAPIVIELEKKKRIPITHELSDEERCKYILSLLKRILSIGYDHLDDIFQTDLLDIQVRVIDKLLEYHSDGIDNTSLETVLKSYLDNCVPLNLSSSNVIGSRYTRLAEIQIQLGRPRDTIIKNACRACEYLPNNQEAQAIKERAENLPRDIWGDNRDIEIMEGESAINGIPLDRYQMDKNTVHDFQDVVVDKSASSILIDCIKDYHWIVLADNSKDDNEKKASLDDYLKYSIDYKSTKTGLQLLNEALKSDDCKKREVAWYALICIGTASKEAWNLLLKSKEARNLYEYFVEGKWEQTYQIINKVTDLLLDKNLPAYKFLRTIFGQRREQIKKLVQMEPQLFIEEIRYFDDILKCLNEMKRCQVFNPTDKNDILTKMYEIINNLKSYETYDDDERIIRLNTAVVDLIPIINLVKYYPTFFGCILFKAPLENWHKKIKVTHTQKKSLRQPKFSVYADPPYIQTNNKKDKLYVESFFSICIENIGQQSAEGFKLDITLTPEDENINPICISGISETDRVGAGKKVTRKIDITQKMPGAKVINVSIDTEAFFGESWLAPVNSRFTLYIPSNTPDNFITNKREILFNTSQTAKDKIFKGRESDMDRLKNHYLSKNKSEIYILYGLSRTGKTSIAENLMRDIEGMFVESDDGRKLTVLPFSWPFEQISEAQDNDTLWSNLLERCILLPINDDYKSDYGINVDIQRLFKNHYDVNDFSIILDALNKAGVYPFIVIDEFQYIKKLLVRQDNATSANLSETFIHSIRQKANQGLASFLFAGTYEIKDLMHNPVYGLNKGQFGTTKEMMINRIEDRYAEELMTVMGNKLQFTREAIQYIHKLSYNVPYFIQIICQACAEYAYSNHRNYLGYPELNHVICCLTGEESGTDEGINRIVEGRFNGNMLDSSHPMELDVLRYITLYNRERLIDPRPVGLNYIKDCWMKEFPDRTENDLRETLELLIEKEVIKDNNDREYNEITYTINVDLFRRWFTFKEKRINN